MKRFFLLSVIALLLVACNKNQKVVKQLDGKWNITSYVYTWDGETVDVLAEEEGYALSWDFNNCKLKDDEFCTIIWTEVYDGIADSFVLEYRVEGNGTSLELRDLDYPSELIYFKIVEQSKVALTIMTDDGDGDNTTITLEKE
ncbi:MAG: hypothetical protein ACI8ZM_003031 [Crocinitomix sp.]|jgi:hypothetical protein